MVGVLYIMLYMFMCRRVAMSNPTQSEGCGVGGNNNDIKMNSNPAYAGVEYTADEGEDVAWIWICTKVHVCSQFRCALAAVQ